MKDRPELAASEGRPDPVGVAGGEVAGEILDAVADRLEVLRPRLRVIEGDDLLATLEEMLHEMAAAESRRARDENRSVALHGRPV